MSFMKRFSYLSRAGHVPALVVFIFLFNFFSLTAAPRGQYYQDENAIAIKEMRDSIEDIRHQVHNHETEIRVFDEKLANFDSIIESVRDQLNDSSKSHKEQLKGSSATLESKITALETSSKGFVADLRQFKTYSTETTVALTQYKQKIGDLEKIIDQQNQNIEHLQAAMRSLMEALQGKSQVPVKTTTDNTSSSTSQGAVSSSDKSYKVKSGDSLEKIARSHQVSIQSLKDANGLTTDRIVVGKTLVIPEK